MAVRSNSKCRALSTWHELRMSTDTRNGGFGPFFGAATLVALAALAWATVRRTSSGTSNRHRIEVLLGLTAYGFVTTILFPEPWWARFVPLAWVIPHRCRMPR